MELKMEIALDPTLGCGQAHRWRKQADGSWQGVIGNSVVTMCQTSDGVSFEGGDPAAVGEYLRADDDLREIIGCISRADPYVAELSSKCPGLRILKQPEWECLGTYLLATNVNVKRIAKMVESVCDHFGTDLGGSLFGYKPETQTYCAIDPCSVDEQDIFWAGNDFEGFIRALDDGNL